MSRARPVKVRIKRRRRDGVYLVIRTGGRYTEHATFEEAWEASLPERASR